MKRLFQIETQKIVPYTAFWVIMGIHALLFLLLSIGGSQMEVQIAGQFNIARYFEFPAVWNTIAWLASWFNLLLAILVIALIGNEYNFRTFKQHIVDGLTREEMLASKLSVIFVIALWATFLVFFTALIMGLVYSSGQAAVFSQAHYVAVYFVQALAYMSFAMLIALLLRNTALSIVLFILYVFPIEPIIRNIFPAPMLPFFPMKVVSDLTPLPKIRTGIESQELQQQVQMLEFQMQAGQGYETPSLLVSVGVGVLYLALFVFLSRLILQKRNF